MIYFSHRTELGQLIELAQLKGSKLKFGIDGWLQQDKGNFENF